VVRVPRRELDTVNPHSQGLAALVSPYPYADLEGILSRRQGERGLILLLDLLQDPQNMGTLLRTAEAVGVDGVVLAPRRGVAITPAVVAASSGACEHLLIAMHNIARALEKLKEAGFWMLGLENRAEAQAFHEVGLPSALGLVVGSEGAGLRRLVADSCDWIVRLPMRGHIGSLNASVAGSIMLYEICRQQGFWEENGDAASDRRAKDPEVGGR
jgi:23S rRNA (guanosine2251-2'-O)-methyltransferase